MRGEDQGREVTEEDDASWQDAQLLRRGPVTLFFVIWVLLSPLRAPTCPPASTAVVAPVPAPGQTTEDRQELLTLQLCDKEVAILLESRDLQRGS